MFSKPLFIVITIAVLTALCVNNFLENPTFTKLTDEAEYYTNCNQLRKAETCYFQIQQYDSTNVSAHYNYISAHFQIPKSERISKRTTIERDDTTIHKIYLSKTLSKDTSVQDIGWYGLGLCASSIEDYAQAARCFSRIFHRDLPHLNNSIGYIHKHYGNLDSAEWYLTKEIRNHGAVSAAYTNLIEILVQQRRLDELQALIADANTCKYFSFRSLREAHFLQRNVIGYWATIASEFWKNFHPLGAISALLIMLTWLYYLRQLDIFEKEKWSYIVLTLFLGMVCTFGTYTLTDALHYFTSFDLNGDMGNDFYYSVFGIGAIEELMKFIPFLLILLYTKEVNEPIDYIIYSSVAGLGFAFIENIMYLDQGGLHLIHGRAFSSTISHMVDSSIIGYGLLLSRYKLKNNIYLTFLISYLLAAFSHGIYDFWLLNDSANSLSIFSTFILIFSLFIYNVFISNSLNNSTFFDKKIRFDVVKLNNYLVYSLSFILILEYVIFSLEFGPDIGNLTFMKSIWGSFGLIYFLSISLAIITLEKGKWNSVFMWFQDKKEKVLPPPQAGKRRSSKSQSMR